MVNCSNHGECKIDPDTLELVCQCLSNFAGTSCQTDSKPCSQNRCLNNATCINVNNMTSYQCECESKLYYGRYCENKVNLCENKTCSGHGYCVVVNGSEPECKCYYGFYGDACDYENLTKKIVKGVQTTSAVIAFIVLALTVFIILSNDGWNLFLERFRRRYRNKKKHSSNNFKSITVIQSL